MDWKTEAQYRAELCRAWELYETTKAALDATQEKLGYAQKVEALVEAAEAALGEIEDIMQEAFRSAYPVCCGRPGRECCGTPEPEWYEADQRMIERLEPHQKALKEALAAYQKQEISNGTA